MPQILSQNQTRTSIFAKTYLTIVAIIFALAGLATTGVTIASASEYAADANPFNQNGNHPVPGYVPIIINFQPEDSPLIYGYEPDFGEEFGERPNGLFYGWNQDNRVNARLRDEPSSPDLAHDTLNHLQKDGLHSWEIALENREYYVIVVGGDPSFLDSLIQIEVEGKIIVEGVPTGENPWVTGSGFVTITDGRLSLTSGEGAWNNKINYIKITGLGFADGPAPLIISLHLPLISRR